MTFICTGICKYGHWGKKRKLWRFVHVPSEYSTHCRDPMGPPVGKVM